MTTTTYTDEARDKLADYLDTHHIPAGMGTEEAACSIAAIHLALTGKMSDWPIDCMSEVIRLATIEINDAIPDDMRNSPRYKAWLLTAPGTGREREQERLAVLMNWMWETVLPQVQPLADEKGFGTEWRKMCEQRTAEAADAATDAAARAPGSAAEFAVACAATANPAPNAAARAAAYAARAVGGNFWADVDPIGVLERMTNLETAQ